MNIRLSIAERLQYSTIKIISVNCEEGISSGTGFFAHLDQQENTVVPVLITNKHVIHDAIKIYFRCHLENENGLPSGEIISLELMLEEKNVFNHPDPTIDLCAISIFSILSEHKIFYTPMTMDLVPEVEDWQYFDAIETITMVGCPNGILDDVNNLPIIRQGITATSLNKPYNGKDEFMIDMACFPGSSGSPIFLYNSNGYLDRKANSFMMGASRIKLIGVLYAGPLLTNTGNIILANPPQVTVNSMMHLGNVIKSTQIKALEEHIITIIENS